MRAVKEHGEISINYRASKTLSNFATLGLIASITVVNPTTASTTAAYPTHSHNWQLRHNNQVNKLWSFYMDSQSFLQKSNAWDWLCHRFTAVRSATMNCNFNPTTTVLASILPYPATTYDAILITIEGWYLQWVVGWQRHVLYCQGNPVHETRVKQCIP